MKERLSLIHISRIEFICTVSEEVGMEGAVALDVSHLKAKKLLNLDSENEGIMLVSCAGAVSYTHLDVYKRQLSS